MRFIMPIWLVMKNFEFFSLYFIIRSCYYILKKSKVKIPAHKSRHPQFQSRRKIYKRCTFTELL